MLAAPVAFRHAPPAQHERDPYPDQVRRRRPRRAAPADLRLVRRWKARPQVIGLARLQRFALVPARARLRSGTWRCAGAGVIDRLDADARPWADIGRFQIARPAQRARGWLWVHARKPIAARVTLHLNVRQTHGTVRRDRVARHCAIREVRLIERGLAPRAAGADVDAVAALADRARIGRL